MGRAGSAAELTGRLMFLYQALLGLMVLVLGGSGSPVPQGSLKGLGDILGLEEITKISPVKSITGVKSIQEVKKITPINEDIALNAINNWQLKNLIKDESVELLESEIEEEEAKELLLERIKEHHRQRERQLREALAIRLGKVKSIDEVKNINEVKNIDEVKSIKGVKSIQEVKPPQEIKSIEEVKHIYELTADQAQELRNTIMRLRSIGGDYIVPSGEQSVEDIDLRRH